MTDHTPARPDPTPPSRGVLEHELYLLRVWYEPSDQPVWRASLHSPFGAPRRYFASRRDLLAYLHAVLEDEHTGPDPP